MSQCIEWTREARRILLPVTVLAPIPVTDLTGVEARALLDTGSSVSGVASRIAAKLSLSRLGKRPLMSAQGEGQVERLAFRLGFQPDAGAFDALLGMDILRRCDFEMRRDGYCRLELGG